MNRDTIRLLAILGWVSGIAFIVCGLAAIMFIVDGRFGSDLLILLVASAASLCASSWSARRLRRHV